MKILKRITVVILIMLFVILSFYNTAYAYTTNISIDTEARILELASSDPIQNPDYYKPQSSGDNTQLINFGKTITGAIRVIGTIIAVVMLMALGFKYMFGTTEERANYKETMIPYLIGAVMLFAITNFLDLIYKLVEGIDF